MMLTSLPPMPETVAKKYLPPALVASDGRTPAYDATAGSRGRSRQGFTLVQALNRWFLKHFADFQM